jgi:phosphate transport system permease protein
MSVQPIETETLQGPNEIFESEGRRASGAWRRGLDIGFRVVCVVVAFASVAILLTLLITISVQASLGITHDSRTVGEYFKGDPKPSPRDDAPVETNVVKNAKSFLRNGPSDDHPWEAGIFPSIMGTIWLVAICGLFTIPIGIGAAIMLEEFKPKSAILRWLQGLVQLNISNLAGVPSVVYGLLGMTAFVQMFGIFGGTMNPKVELGVHYYDRFVTTNGFMLLKRVESKSSPQTVHSEGMEMEMGKGTRVKVHILKPGQSPPSDDAIARVTLRSTDLPERYPRRSWYYLQLPFGYSVLSGGLTLMLVVLPVVIIASQEALRAVPESLREGCLGLGATRWQTIWHVTLPAAIPGIMTGAILAMSRAIGEAAPLLIVVAAVVQTAPKSLMDECFALPLQIHEWAMHSYSEFQNLAACAIVVLLVLLLSCNAIAIIIRQRFSKPLS